MNQMKLTPEQIREWGASFNWRTMFTNSMVLMAQRDERIVYIAADLGRAFGYGTFMKKFPERTFNAGIAEQSAVSFAAGLASCGLVPYFVTFAPFAALRPCEQIKMDCAYAGYPVRIVGTDSGVGSCMGNTHYGYEDAGVMCAIPEMTVISPCDATEIFKAVEALADYPHPAYLRIFGGDIPMPVYTSDYNFEIGKAVVLKKGKDVTLAACGNMVTSALSAADLLGKEGIDAEVINVHTLKPLDCPTILNSAKKTGLVVSIEEHTVCGGLGTQIADCLAAASPCARLYKIGLPDTFPLTITHRENWLKNFGLTPKAIAETVKKQLK